MKKSGEPLTFRIIVIIIIFLLIECAVFLYMYSNPNKSLTGFSVNSKESENEKANVSNIFFIGYAIKSTIVDGYSKMSLFSRIFLMSQWFLLFFILFFVGIRGKKQNRDEENLEIKIDPSLGKKKTDLDLLYEVLQDKKELKISTISKVFKVNKDIAMEWCKILEGGNLAKIDYSGFGEPSVKILTQQDKKERNKDNR